MVLLGILEKEQEMTVKVEWRIEGCRVRLNSALYNKAEMIAYMCRMLLRLDLRKRERRLWRRRSGGCTPRKFGLPNLHLFIVSRCMIGALFLETRNWV